MLKQMVKVLAHKMQNIAADITVVCKNLLHICFKFKLNPFTPNQRICKKKKKKCW